MLKRAWIVLSVFNACGWLGALGYAFATSESLAGLFSLYALAFILFVIGWPFLLGPFLLYTYRYIRFGRFSSPGRPVRVEWGD